MMNTLPAEWDAQRALMLTWPHPRTDWRDQLEAVEAVYVEIARATIQHQEVLILCPDASWQARVTRRLEQAGVPLSRLIFALVPSNDTWVRDYGPITVLDASGRACLVDFRFNGWGGKYASELDDGISARLRDAGYFPDVDWQRSELVLEGGAIDSDGAGTLLAMHRTLIDPARNPGWSQPEIERELRQRLGIQRMLWLTQGQLSGDDTDGHIDTLARFVDRRTIAHVTCDDPTDPDYESIQRMIEELIALRDPDGEAYRLLPLPSPRPQVDDGGQRLPAGYANFALINGAVLLPLYHDPADAEALRRLRAAFPGRRVHGIDARALIRQGGSLHCACMQLPAAVPIRKMPPPRQSEDPMTEARNGAAASARLDPPAQTTDAGASRDARGLGRVLVGLSGGVDSAVAAHLLIEQGYRVEALFMKNWEEDDTPGYCAAATDLADAQAVAERLGIPLRTVNFASEYWELVFERFLAEYRALRTPNPDILCNSEIKFRAFLDHALDLGADWIGTGHYARVTHQRGQAQLRLARDGNKDQTYFLHRLDQTQLGRALFPLADQTKPRVRALARQLGLANAGKKDSTGICFIGERRFADFLARYLPRAPGPIETPGGQVLGEHQGLAYYTIGQRQGLGIGGQRDAGEAPWFVAAKEPARNALVVVQGGDHPLLFAEGLRGEQLHWISGAPPGPAPLDCLCRLRHRQPLQACTLIEYDKSLCQVRFAAPQRAVTPGQSAVFYRGDQCLGGCVITAATR